MMFRYSLRGRGDLDEWRDAARGFMMAGITPEFIEWRTMDDADGLFGFDDNRLPPPANPPPKISVQPSFIRLAEAVICHSDPTRFALLYRLLFRLFHSHGLLNMATDRDVAAARQLAKSVGRDYHKMTAFVRFKEISLPERKVGRRRFVAWFEPDHFIVDRVAPFFQRRFTDMDWLIATPKGSASWDGEKLKVNDDPAPRPDLRDETDDLWRTYYASIFNPARLKVKMMMAEMPKKYWKNLPEAELIPGLIAKAEADVLEMAVRRASEPLPFHHRIQEAAARAPTIPLPAAGTLAAVREAARSCTRCDIHCLATQTVFGEGPADADVMVIGEQPGDHEDLVGRPFVGPAGTLFEEALKLAGIERDGLYVTNAVKHFKYQPRGKRRIHQKPNMGEVRQCRWWLRQELELVKPKLIVAMGATALFALTDMRQKLADIRSEPIAMEEGRTLFVTVHPSYLLRIVDEDLKQKEIDRFRGDFASVKRLM